MYNTGICHFDELRLFTTKLQEILRRIWFISEKKKKPSESIYKQSCKSQTQVIKMANNCSYGLKLLFLNMQAINYQKMQKI